MQACGLKPLRVAKVPLHFLVTPHAGVWIETNLLYFKSLTAVVTPHAGVWIETSAVTVRSSGKITRSRLMQACGLKPNFIPNVTDTLTQSHASCRRVD